MIEARLVLFAMPPHLVVMRVLVPPPPLRVTLQLLVRLGLVHHHSSITGRVLLWKGPGQVCGVLSLWFFWQLVEDSHQGFFVLGRGTRLLQAIQHNVAQIAGQGSIQGLHVQLFDTKGLKQPGSTQGRIMVCTSVCFVIVVLI